MQRVAFAVKPKSNSTWMTVQYDHTTVLLTSCFKLQNLECRNKLENLACTKIILSAFRQRQYPKTNTALLLQIQSQHVNTPNTVIYIVESLATSYGTLSGCAVGEASLHALVLYCFIPYRIRCQLSHLVGSAVRLRPHGNPLMMFHKFKRSQIQTRTHTEKQP